MANTNSRSNSLRTALCLVTAFAALPSLAQEEAMPTTPAPKQGLRLSPVLVQSSQSGANSLGLDFAWAPLWRLESSQGGSRDFPPTLDGVYLHAAVFALDARGSLTSASSDKSHPPQSLDATAAYELRSKPVYARVGLTARVETDQNLDRRQSQFGLSALASKSSAFTLGDTLSVLTLYGTVQPDKDVERKALLGQLSRYERWNLDATYTVPLMRKSERPEDPVWRKTRSLELGYRHWQELSPPLALRGSGLDRQRLGYLRLNLDGDYFIQYSRGRQPFDQQGQRAIKLGWEMKLSHSTLSPTPGSAPSTPATSQFENALT